MPKLGFRVDFLAPGSVAPLKRAIPKGPPPVDARGNFNDPLKPSFSALDPPAYSNEFETSPEACLEFHSYKFNKTPKISKPIEGHQRKHIGTHILKTMVISRSFI